MFIIKPSAKILYIPSKALQRIEYYGRVCYKSEPAGDPESFVKKRLEDGHLSIMEHISITCKVVCDRGVSHEIVRHRLASYSQESTRYCNYSKQRFGQQITVIAPCFLKPFTKEWYIWENACKESEKAYFELLNAGLSAQCARDILPTSLKTEIIMTMNIREWLHFFELRCASNAHPQMQEIANILQKEFHNALPAIF